MVLLGAHCGFTTPQGPSRSVSLRLRLWMTSGELHSSLGRQARWQDCAASRLLKQQLESMSLSG